MLPDLLKEARKWQADANAAASHVVAAFQSGQEHKVRQYVSEWQHASDMCSQSIEDWWLLVNIDELSEQERAMRDAAKTYTASINAARGEESF